MAVKTLLPRGAKVRRTTGGAVLSIGLIASASTPVSAAGAVDTAQHTSTRVGGYVVRGGEHLARVSFVVPSIRCGADETGVATSMVAYDRAGKLITGVGIDARCADSTAAYSVVIISGDFTDPVAEASAGDHVRITYRHRRDGLRMILHNRTRGDRTGYLDPGAQVQAGTIEIGARPSALRGMTALPLAQFDAFPMRRPSVDREPPDAADATTLVDEDGTPQVRPSPPKSRRANFVLHRVD